MSSRLYDHIWNVEVLILEYAFVRRSSKDLKQKETFSGTVLMTDLCQFMILVFTEMKTCVEHYPDADVLVNFASLRSAYDATIDALNYPQVCRFIIC